MNITRQKTGELTEKITLQITKNDYAADVEKTLKDYKKKANMPGFRPGKVPMNLIERMYGKSVLLEQLNTLISKSLDEYIQSQNISLLGEPMLSKDSAPLDIDQASDFEVSFDIGLQPEITIEWPKKEKLLQYEIIVDDELINNEISNFASLYGKSIDVDSAEIDSIVYGDIQEVDEAGNPVENGFKAENVTLFINSLKDEEEKKVMLGAKKDDVVKIAIKKWFNDDEIHNLLKLKKNQDNSFSDYFQIKISAIRKFEKAEMNQEFFDKVYGENTVHSEEEFRNKVVEGLIKDCQFRVEPVNINELKKFMISTQTVSLPVDFLKRWIKENQKEQNDEELEKEFPLILDDFKWQLIKNKIVRDNNINVSEDDIMAYARDIVRWEFKANYGILNLPEDRLDNFSQMLLQKEEDVRRMASDVLNVKVLDIVKTNVNVDIKKVTLKEFLEINK
jgi:trigger factor